MKKVYIAGPYTKGDPAANTARAMQIGHLVMDMDHAPYVPHLSHFMHIHEQRPYEDWINLDLEFVKVCDVLFRIEGESPGADNEVKLAKELGIPVFTDLGLLISYLQDEA